MLPVLWAARATRQLLLRLVWYAEGWWRDQSDPDRLADACRDADRRSLLGHLGIGAPLQRYVLGELPDQWRDANTRKVWLWMSGTDPPAAQLIAITATGMTQNGHHLPTQAA